MSVNQFRKKSVIISAMLFTEETKNQCFNFVTCNKSAQHDDELKASVLAIQTLEGVMIANVGDYIIKGIKGEFYPCKPDIFLASYEAVKPGNDLMTFGQAIEAAKMGKKIARKGWNGSRMFAYIVPGNSYHAQTEAIKGVFDKDLVPYRAYWALKTAQDDVAMWAPSGSDSLAEDWVVVE